MTYAAITFLCLMWAGFLGICLLAWWLARSVNKEITKPKEIPTENISVAVSLPEEMGRLAHTRIKQALYQTHGNKPTAAKLLGLPSYQTLTNWMEKYGVTGPVEP